MIPKITISSDDGGESQNDLKKILQTALRMIQIDDHSLFLTANLLNLINDLYTLPPPQVPEEVTSKATKLYRYLIHILTDLELLWTLTLRLDWQREVLSLPHEGPKSENPLDGLIAWKSQWDIPIAFIRIDIEFFFKQMRIIFDRIARIIDLLSARQLKTSFNKLKKKVLDGTYRTPWLEEDLAEFVASCEWFDSLREIRVKIEHYSAQAFPLPDLDGMYFQVLSETWDSLVKLPKSLQQGHLTPPFEFYFSIYYAYLIEYLERLSSLCYKYIDLQQKSSIKHYHLGLKIIQKWLNQALESL